MVDGVGGSSFAAELERMQPMTGGVQPIAVAEYQARVAKAQRLMRAQGVDALYLDTSSNLRYFTGIPLTLTPGSARFGSWSSAPNWPGSRPPCWGHRARRSMPAHAA